jgi:uncharacterized protein YjiS (DUF1127 family)
LALSLKAVGVIRIPDSAGTLLDHGAFEPRSHRVFVAHTARDRIEVINYDPNRHLARAAAHTAMNVGRSKNMPNPVNQGSPLVPSHQDDPSTSANFWLRTIRTWITQVRQRKAFGELAELNDYLVKDIGLSKHDVAVTPFWHNEFEIRGGERMRHARPLPSFCRGH